MTAGRALRRAPRHQRESTGTAYEAIDRAAKAPKTYSRRIKHRARRPHRRWELGEAVRPGTGARAAAAGRRARTCATETTPAAAATPVRDNPARRSGAREVQQKSPRRQQVPWSASCSVRTAKLPGSRCSLKSFCDPSLRGGDLIRVHSLSHSGATTRAHESTTGLLPRTPPKHFAHAAPPRRAVVLLGYLVSCRPKPAQRPRRAGSRDESSGARNARSSKPAASRGESPETKARNPAKPPNCI